MAIRLTLLLAVLLIIEVAAFAAPIAVTAPGRIEISASSHSIRHGADAGSRIFEADAGIRGNYSLVTEFASIDDDFGRTNITSLLLKHQIEHVSLPENINLAGYAGLIRISVTENTDSTDSDSGIALGITADKVLNDSFTLYGRAGIAFLEESVWTLDAGIRYEIRPDWFLTVGYRDYKVGGSSLGGFLVGATYRISK